MREVDHVLVEHSVWIAQYEGVMLFVDCFGVGIVGSRRVRSKEHAVNLNRAVTYPAMLTIEGLCKDLSHLPRMPKHAPEEHVPVRAASSVAASDRPDRHFAQVKKLLGRLDEGFCLTVVFFQNYWPVEREFAARARVYTLIILNLLLVVALHKVHVQS